MTCWAGKCPVPVWMFDVTGIATWEQEVQDRLAHNEVSQDSTS